MSLCSWDSAPEPVRSQVRRFVRDARAILGDTLVGIYLHGSLAMGCFNPEQSDVDLIAVISQHMPPEKRRLMAGLMLTLSGAPSPLEISFLLEPALREWRHPFPYEFHYSEAWRARFEANLTRLDWPVWTDLHQTDPDLAAHLTILTAKAGVVLFGAPIHELFPTVPAIDYIDSLLYDFEPARDGIMADPVYGVLNLLRVFWYLSDGRISSKAEAGAWGAEVLPDPELREVAALAGARYAGEATEREFLPEALKRFATYVDAQVDRLLPGRLTAAEPPQSSPVPECLRCRVPLRFGGIRQFRDGENLAGAADVLHVYYCPKCGKVELFLHPIPDAGTAAEAEEPYVPDEEPGQPGSEAEELECLACGQRIPAQRDRCENCGWTWK